MAGETKMAPCRVCGHMVSEFAPQCPGCGDPTAARYGHKAGSERKPTNPWMIIGWILLLLILLPLATCALIVGNTAKDAADSYRSSESQPAAAADNFMEGTASAAPALTADVVSLLCERTPSGNYTKAEITIRNTGPEIEFASAFMAIAGEVSQTGFSPYTVPSGSIATATFMEQRKGDCEVKAVQDRRGHSVTLTKR